MSRVQAYLDMCDRVHAAVTSPGYAEETARYLHQRHVADPLAQLRTAASEGNCLHIFQTLSRRPGIDVDDALEAAALGGHREAVNMLLKSTALCRHGGLSPIQVALHHPRVGCRVRVAMARLLLSERDSTWYRRERGQTLLAAACLRDGPALLAALVLDGHLSESAGGDDEPPEPQLRRRKKPNNFAPTLAGAVLLNRQVRFAVEHANGTRADTRGSYDEYATYRDAKHVLCGDVRVSIRPSDLGVFNHAGEQLRQLLGGRSRGWTPSTHRQFPAAFKAAVRTVLLVAGRADSPLHRLPSEALHLIFERTAELWFWDLEYALRLAEDPALREVERIDGLPAVSSAFTALDL